MIRGFGHVEMDVSDLGRSLSFYRNLLGTEPIHQDEEHLHFQLVSQDMILRKADAPPIDGTPRFSLEVVDAVAYHFLLQVRGIDTSVAPVRSAEGWMTGLVYDPDGHAIAYVQKE